MFDGAKGRGVGECVEVGDVVGAEPGKEGQVVGAGDGRHRVNLNNPQPLQRRRQMPGGGRGRALREETLGSQDAGYGAVPFQTHGRTIRRWGF